MSSLSEHDIDWQERFEKESRSDVLHLQQGTWPGLEEDHAGLLQPIDNVVDQAIRPENRDARQQAPLGSPHYTPQSLGLHLQPGFESPTYLVDNSARGSPRRSPRLAGNGLFHAVPDAPVFTPASRSVYSNELSSPAEQSTHHGGHQYSNFSTPSRGQAYSTPASRISGIGFGSSSRSSDHLSETGYNPFAHINPALLTSSQQLQESIQSRDSPQPSFYDSQPRSNHPFSTGSEASYPATQQDQQLQQQQQLTHTEVDTQAFCPDVWPPSNPLVSTRSEASLPRSGLVQREQCLGRPLMPRPAEPSASTAAPPLDPSSTLSTGPSQPCPYHCTVVGCKRKKGFKTKAALGQHMRYHEDPANPHLCDHEQCNKSFRFFKDLEKHARTHSPERPWSCSVFHCAVQEKAATAGFRRKDQWRRHMKKSHSPVFGLKRALMMGLIALVEEPVDLASGEVGSMDWILEATFD